VTATTPVLRDQNDRDFCRIEEARFDRAHRATLVASDEVVDALRTLLVERLADDDAFRDLVTPDGARRTVERGGSVRRQLARSRVGIDSGVAVNGESSFGLGGERRSFAAGLHGDSRNCKAGAVANRPRKCGILASH